MKLQSLAGLFPVLLVGAGLLLPASASAAGRAAARTDSAADGLSVCGGFPKQGGGPYDYRHMRGTEKLGIIERNHFTPNVESLLSGNTTAFVGGELGFTLRAVPNHHRAMLAIIRLGEKLHTTKPKGSEFTVECWMDRAVRFAPDDTVARIIFAGWLGKNGRVPEAVAQLKHAAHLAGDNALTHYNVGMAYLELQQHDLALEEAHKAAALGFERPELKDGLLKAGKWVEPTVPSTVPPPDAAASAAAQAASAPNQP